MTDIPTPAPLVPSQRAIEPCPFCGGEASAAGITTYSRPQDSWWEDGTPVERAYFVNCLKCFATTRGMFGGQQTREKAITAWNTRAERSNPGADVERLRAALEGAEAAQLNLYQQAEHDRKLRERAEEAFALVSPFIAKFAAAVPHYEGGNPQYPGTTIFMHEPDPGYRDALTVSSSRPGVPPNGPTLNDLRMLADAYALALALATPPRAENAQVGGERLGYSQMGSVGRCDLEQLREAIAEATTGVRGLTDNWPDDIYPGHVSVSGINYNSLNRIVTAFVDAALTATPQAPTTPVDGVKP